MLWELKCRSASPLSWATDIISRNICSEDDANVLVCGVWALWTGRNARSHGSGRRDPGAAVRHIAKIEPQTTRAKEVWKPPDPGWVKVNTDGAFDASSGRGAAGVILRNERGETLAAEGRKLENLGDALTAEALAARNGVLLAVAIGYNKVILELDNQSLANSLKSVENDRSPISDLLHSIQELGSCLLSFSVSFVHGEANLAAHCCAKVPNGIEEPMWSTFGYAPDWLMGVVTSDCNSVES